MAIRDEMRPSNYVVLGVGFLVFVAWVVAWITTRAGVTLLWLLVYLAMVPFVALIPAPPAPGSDSRLGARGWPTAVAIGLLVLGSIASAAIAS